MSRNRTVYMRVGGRDKPPVRKVPPWFTDEMLEQARLLYPQYEFKRQDPQEVPAPWRIHE